MSTAKKILYELIEEMPDKDISEVIDYVQFLKLKKDKELYSDLIGCSESTIKFWNNNVDDEVWNNV